MVIPVRRRRWRAALVIMHAALVPYAFIKFIMLIIPVLVHPSTTDYNLIIALTFLIFLYAIFGFLVFWIFKYLLRLLCFIAALLLFFIGLFFIVNYFLSVDCSYKQQTTVNITITNKDCQLVVNNTDFVVFQCDNKLSCGTKCLPLAKFWQNISKGNRIYMKAFLMPMTFAFSAYVITVLILTIWRGVDEIRFQKDICIFGIHEDHWPPPVVHPMVYSAAKSHNSAKTASSIQTKASEDAHAHAHKKPKGFHVKSFKKSKLKSPAPPKAKPQKQLQQQTRAQNICYNQDIQHKVQQNVSYNHLIQPGIQNMGLSHGIQPAVSKMGHKNVIQPGVQNMGNFLGMQPNVSNQGLKHGIQPCVPNMGHNKGIQPGVPNMSHFHGIQHGIQNMGLKPRVQPGASSMVPNRGIQIGQSNMCHNHGVKPTVVSNVLVSQGTQAESSCMEEEEEESFQEVQKGFQQR